MGTEPVKDQVWPPPGYEHLATSSPESANDYLRRRIREATEQGGDIIELPPGVYGPFGEDAGAGEGKPASAGGGDAGPS